MANYIVIAVLLSIIVMMGDIGDAVMGHISDSMADNIGVGVSLFGIIGVGVRNVGHTVAGIVGDSMADNVGIVISILLLGVVVVMVRVVALRLSEAWISPEN